MSKNLLICCRTGACLTRLT